jgi:chromosome segregation ATPase
MASARGCFMKKLLIGGLIVLAGLWLLHRTFVASYVGTLWGQVQQEVKQQIPVRFELQRIRHEIAQLDKDIRGMVGPIAEHMANIEELRQDIQRKQERLAQEKARLLRLTEALAAGNDPVSWQGKRMSAERLRARMQQDFAQYKALEQHLATQEKLLAAREKALEGAREQLNRLITKKREFEIQVANLEAEQQLLEAAGTGTNLQVDDSRATQIQAALDAVRHQQIVLQHKLKLLTGEIPSDATPPAAETTVTVEEVQRYLQETPPVSSLRTAQP